MRSSGAFFCFGSILSAAFLLAGIRAARAEAEEELIHLEYTAIDACPGRSAFVEEVQARTARARFVDSSSGVRIFVVAVEPEGEGAKGRLTSRRGDVVGAPRQVTGKTCADVVSALALIAALAIDPQASTSPRPAPVPAPPLDVAPAPLPPSSMAIPVPAWVASERL